MITSFKKIAPSDCKDLPVNTWLGNWKIATSKVKWRHCTGDVGITCPFGETRQWNRYIERNNRIPEYKSKSSVRFQIFWRARNCGHSGCCVVNNRVLLLWFVSLLIYNLNSKFFFYVAHVRRSPVKVRPYI